ncbi:MAG: disulfide oxidoreductase, partial [Rhodobacteraceae bacterium]|nr:disulfide oxidoreductase [Paracoccaceae bacterium]
DALHERLTQRFVDRRTSVLLRRLKQKEALLAEVNDKGEVTVEGEFVGRLEGFRFRQDKDATGQEAKTLKTASLQALAPHFHLRADRFYNAPDTEMDFTEQGGLMWGDQAVGKLAAGDDPLKPRIVAFVDEEAGADVAAKVQRRLQHFIDRKIAALFEPLINLQKDETLNGLARGFAFRMVESMGILPRADVADDVKALDQDARGMLRKHGLRFGQFTVFMPLLLKPAPTRLRLVLWSLAKNLDVFPEAPPPGLVTVPNMAGTPAEHHTVSGYRAAGDRAIRIDMLERLADLLRAQDSRGGFEANPDMLSITGLTLEQFADLMGGLGYKAEKGEREKVRAVDAVVPEANAAVAVEQDAAIDGAVPVEDTPVMDAAQEGAPGADAAIAEAPEAADVSDAAAAMPEDGVAPVADVPSDAVAETPVPTNSETEIDPGAAPDAALAGPETEEFYTFTWRGNRPDRQPRRDGGAGKGRRDGGKPQGDRPRGKGKPKGKGQPPRDAGTKTFQARPPKKEKPIDPDNPFAAALMGLKTKD